LALTPIGFFGGRTIVDGVSDASEIENWRIGGKFSTPIAKGQSLRFQYHVGAYTNMDRIIML
jgi:hypothetical protein